MPSLGEKHIIKVALFVATFFCSCDEQRNEVINQQPIKGEPAAIAYDIRMVYTDSLEIKAILTAPEHQDFTNLSLPHSKFPRGLQVTFLDELKRENIITAEYGILYDQTGIIDLQGNVVLQASDGGLLETPQLYWAAEEEWIFTEATFNFSNADYDVIATRLDTNKEFTKFKTGKLTGTVAVQEDTTQ